MRPGACLWLDTWRGMVPAVVLSWWPAVGRLVVFDDRPYPCAYFPGQVSCLSVSPRLFLK